MKSYNVLAICLFVVSATFGQSSDALKKELDDLNKAIDQAVVDRKIDFLKKHYADDFVFTHFTGLVDSKESWIKNVEKLTDQDRYTKRQHDSTTVELHGNTAIIFGRLDVTRESGQKINSYALWYVRVFEKRKNVWQMISHRSTSEVKK